MLTDAAVVGGAGAQWAAAAGRDMQAWYAVNDQAYRLDRKARYPMETQLVIGPADARPRGSPGSRVTLPGHRPRQAVFHTGATAGGNAFTGLEAGVIVAALLMAPGAPGACPSAGGVPVITLLSRDQATAAVAAAVAERDTIQANLLELDDSFGKWLLAGGS